MKATELIAEVERAGGRIRVDGSDLVLTADHPLDGGLVDRVRQHKPEVIEALEVTTPSEKVNTPATTSLDILQRGVVRWGVAIGIDRLTGSALLMCSESDCQAVSSVADVYRPPFGIDLTDAQRQEIEHDIEFMEAAHRRRKCRDVEQKHVDMNGITCTGPSVQENVVVALGFEPENHIVVEFDQYDMWVGDEWTPTPDPRTSAPCR